MKTNYFVSYNAVNKYIGNLFGHTCFETDGKIESSEDVKSIKDKVADVLFDEYQAEFNVVILNFILMKEESR